MLFSFDIYISGSLNSSNIYFDDKLNQGTIIRSASGYNFGVEAGDFRQTKKMILLKQNYFYASNPISVGFFICWMMFKFKNDKFKDNTSKRISF